MEPSEYAETYMLASIKGVNRLYPNCALYEFIDQFSVNEIRMLISSTVIAIDTAINSEFEIVTPQITRQFSPIATACKFLLDIIPLHYSNIKI